MCKNFWPVPPYLCTVPHNRKLSSSKHNAHVADPPCPTYFFEFYARPSCSRPVAVHKSPLFGPTRPRRFHLPIYQQGSGPPSALTLQKTQRGESRCLGFGCRQSETPWRYITQA